MLDILKTLAVHTNNPSLNSKTLQTSGIGFKHVSHARRELFPDDLFLEIKVRVLWIWKQRLFKSSATKMSCLHMYLSNENVKFSPIHSFTMYKSQPILQTNFTINVSLAIYSLQGRRIHAAIHYDNIHLFAPKLQLHETYYIRDYDMTCSLLISTGDDFYYDIIFQPTTTLHPCPSSVIPNFLFSPTEFSTIKSIDGYDTFVTGKS